MGRQIEELARFAACTQWQDVPTAVQSHTKLVLLDTLGVMLAGAQRPEIGELRERLAPTAGTGATVYARGWPGHDPRTAALLNGIGGRSIELCEGLRLVTGQAAMQVLPGVLAVGEHADSAGSEMLAAFIVGYDLAARFNFAFTPRPLAHQNGQASLIAAVAAGARLRGLDAAGVSLAMRIATTLVMTPSYTNAVAGATTLNVAGGMSGFAAALAPDLALAGFTAQDDAIEEALGHLVGGGFKPEGLLDELGTRWEITRNYFRLYACCNPIHPALDMVKEALAALKPAGRGRRAHRHRDVPLRVRDAQSGSAEFFRVEVFAAARRGGDGRARQRRPLGDRRHGIARSRDCRVAPARAYHRRPRDERGRAAAAPCPRDADAEGRPANHSCVRESSRRLQPAFRRIGDTRKISRARGYRADAGRKQAG